MCFQGQLHSTIWAITYFLEVCLCLVWLKSSSKLFKGRGGILYCGFGNLSCISTQRRNALIFIIVLENLLDVSIHWNAYDCFKWANEACRGQLLIHSSRILQLKNLNRSSPLGLEFEMITKKECSLAWRIYLKKRITISLPVGFPIRETVYRLKICTLNHILQYRIIIYFILK